MSAPGVSPVDSFAARLPASASWPATPDEPAIRALPAGPAVYLLHDDAARPVQLATTQDLRRALLARLVERTDADARRADLGAIVRGVRWCEVHSAFEARWRYWQLARELHALDYRERVGFGPVYFLCVDNAAAVPEIEITTKVWSPVGGCVGPWPTQAAAREALAGLWDLFDLCRYPEQVRRAPHGARCAYAEMGRCDAPCDGGAPLPAYRERVRAAWRFACGAIDAWQREATERMKAAATAQRFEAAGLLKAQLAFAARWRRQWPLVRPVDDWQALFAIPVPRRRSWKLFHFARGELRAGPVARLRELAGAARTFVSAAAPSVDRAADEIARMEQAWLFAQFLFRRESAHAALVWLAGAAATPPELCGEVLHAQADRLSAAPRSTAGPAPSAARAPDETP
ncbi:MAG: hypothetical protein AB7Q17_14825 [Phycisphaerae bacterium]